jgi:hypothetical protein
VALREARDRPVSRLRSRPARGAAEAMDLMAGDDRREQGTVIIQAVDSGRQIVAEVFAGMVLDEAKVSALLNARSRIIEQWGKAQHAGLVIGQTLLHLSRTLSEEEFRQVRRGSDRLFPFSDSLATKFRRAAALAEEWRIPPDRLPPYTALYELSTLPPEGQNIAWERGLIRPDVRQAEVVALRRELKAHKLRTPPVLIEGAVEDVPAVTVSREAVERRHSDLLAEREQLAARLAEVDREVAALAEQLALLTGDPGIEDEVAE